jgi:hypothetical protein
LPIVATRHDPPDPDLASKFKVRLVAPHDKASLTEALLELASSPEMRTKMSTANHTHLHEFTWSNIALKHIDIYQNILRYNNPKILNTRFWDMDFKPCTYLVEARNLDVFLNEKHVL